MKIPMFNTVNIAPIVLIEVRDWQRNNWFLIHVSKQLMKKVFLDLLVRFSESKKLFLDSLIATNLSKKLFLDSLVRIKIVVS